MTRDELWTWADAQIKKIHGDLLFPDYGAQWQPDPEGEVEAHFLMALAFLEQARAALKLAQIKDNA